MKRKSLYFGVLFTLLLCCALVFSGCAPRDTEDGTGTVSGQTPSGDTPSEGTGSGTENGTGGGEPDDGEDSRPVGSGGDVFDDVETDPAHTCAGEKWTKVKAATCAEEGEEVRKCDKCDEVLETRVIAKTAHSVVSHAGQAATCTGEGWKAYDTCENCEYNTYESLEALGHDIAHHEEKAPTCKATGFAAYDACSRDGCDYTTFAGELPTVDHSYAQDRRCVWCNKEYGGQPLAYDSHGDGTCTLTGIGTYTGTALEVPQKAMNGDVVVAIGEGAFAESGITSVTFAEDSRVTLIGKNAFKACPSLETVVLPTSVKSIGANAFAGCAYLWCFTVPEDGALKSIEKEAFANCTALSSFTLPSGVESIGVSAFYGCRRLVEVFDLSEALTVRKGYDSENGSIGYYAVDVKTRSGDSGAWMSEDGFRFYSGTGGCYLLGARAVGTVLTLPEDCNGEDYAILQYAFYGCDALVEVTLPNAVTGIGKLAFANCRALSAFRIGGESGLSSIGESAFLNCSLLSSILLPAGLTEIGENAFLRCYRLVEIYDLTEFIDVEKKDTENHGGVGAYALGILTDGEEESRVFSDANGYVFYAETHSQYLIGYDGTGRNLTLPQSCKGKSYHVNRYAFYGNTAVKSVTFSGEVTGIGEYAFGDCTSLEAVIIAESVNRIDANAFAGCEALTNATFKLVKIWKCTDESGDVIGVTASSATLGNKEEAATLLKSTYVSKYWMRTDPDPDWSGWY